MIPHDTIDKLALCFASLSELGAQLTEAQWKLQSDCPGWSVQDNLSHIVAYESAESGGARTSHQAPQFDYVRNYFAGFSNALFGVNFTNPISGYAHYIDADSWIDHAMVSVTTFNVDAIRLSGYFYKDRGKPMEMGPVWDADRTFGAPDDRQINPRVWRNPVSDGGTDVFNAPGPGPAHHWFPQLFRDINFWQRYIDRYQTFRQGPYSLANL